MKTLLIACLLATSATTSAWAQPPSEVSPLDTPPPGNRTPETKAERQRNTAAKLSGLLSFIQNACPDLQPDYDRFKDVAQSLGVTGDDLSSGDLLLRSRAYTETYAKDAATNCARADANFGPAGTTIPGLIAKRAAP